MVPHAQLPILAEVFGPPFDFIFLVCLLFTTASCACLVSLRRHFRTPTEARTRCASCPACGSPLVLLDKRERTGIYRYCYHCDYTGPHAINEELATEEWNAMWRPDHANELLEARR